MSDQRRTGAPMTTSVTAPLLEVRDLGVDFDIGGGQVHAVRGVSFTLHPRDRLGIVGESGCGKSTVVLAVMGLLPPNAAVSGQVLLDGVDILAGGDSGMRPHRWRDISMVFQGAMNAFNPVRTVGDQIAEPIRMHRKASRRDADKSVAELLDMVGIPAARAACYPHEFSGGMRQRAALAMALACGPKVLLADEPTTALDVIVQAEILQLLRRVSDDLGVALVFISHDLPAVAQVTERVAVMYAGRVVEQAPVSRLLTAPRHPYAAALLAAIPRPGAAATVRSIPGEPPRLDTTVTGCAFAPRCASVLDNCRITEPPNIFDGEGVVACHLAAPVGLLQ
jgi:oligopeptide/dipeptide ABC transporter ATP-binding protein